MSDQAIKPGHIRNQTWVRLTQLNYKARYRRLNKQGHRVNGNGVELGISNGSSPHYEYEKLNRKISDLI